MKVAQSCPILCNSMDYTDHRILQAQNTGLGSLSLLQGSSQHREWTGVSCIEGELFTKWAIGGQWYIKVKSEYFLTSCRKIDLKLIKPKCKIRY